MRHVLVHRQPLARTLEAALPVSERLPFLRTILVPDSPSPPAYVAVTADFWARLEEWTGDPLIGLHVAERFPLNRLGAIYLLPREALTLRTAARLFARLAILQGSPGDVELSESPSTAFIRFKHLPHMPPGPDFQRARHHAYAARVGLVCRVARMLVDGLEFERCELVGGSSTARQAYEKFFRCPVAIVSNGTATLYCDPAWLSRRVRGAASASPPRQLDDRANRELSSLPPSIRDLGRFRALYRAAVQRGEYSADEIADDIGAAERTLRRELNRLGTRHGALLEEARYHLASLLLSEDRAEIPWVARRLGYDSARGFVRAFRRWTGRAPKAR